MSETIRLYTYRELLGNRRVITRQELLDRLEISPATLKRDLAKLRDQMNTPIVFDKDLGGYRLETTSGEHELPGVWFSADELLALLTIQNMIVELMPSLLGPKLRPLQRKIDEMLRKQGLDPDTLAERTRLVHAGKRRFNLRHFETLAKATLERNRLRIRHFNRERGEYTDRDISPQQLVHYRDNWYVDAKCHLRREIRCFAVDAIEDAQILEASADEVDKDMLRQAMKASYGIFAGAPKAWAQLRFSAQRARWVRNEQWHPDQRQAFGADGSMGLAIPYSDPRELLGDILRHGADVQVMGPPELVADVAQAVQQMHDNLLDHLLEQPFLADHLAPVEEILEVVTEGGSVKLVGVAEDGAWRFQVRTNEIGFGNSDLSSQPLRQLPWLVSWHAALKALDAYPWHQLHPLHVHQDFKRDIASALQARISKDDHESWKRWQAVI